MIPPNASRQIAVQARYMQVLLEIEESTNSRIALANVPGAGLEIKTIMDNCSDRIRVLKLEKVQLDCKMKGLVAGAARTQHCRDSASDTRRYAKPGRPSVLAQNPGLIKTIDKIVLQDMNSQAAHKRRRTGASIQHVTELHAYIYNKACSFKSNVYLIGSSKKRESICLWKRHHPEGANVRVRAISKTHMKEHMDSHYCLGLYGRKRDRVSRQ